MERAPNGKSKRQKKVSYYAKRKKQRLREKRKLERVHVSVRIDDPFLVLDEKFVQKAAHRRIQKVYKKLIAKISNLSYPKAYTFMGIDARGWWHAKKEGLSDLDRAFLKSMTKKEFVERYFMALDYVSKENALSIAKSLSKEFFKQEIKDGKRDT